MHNPKLVVLEGSSDCINYLESYLGIEITERDLYDPELMGQWIKIIKGAGKVLKKLGQGMGRRHRRKESERVAIATLKIKRERIEKRKRYAENVEKARSKASEFFQMSNIKKPKTLLTLGLPIAALGAYYMLQR